MGGLPNLLQDQPCSAYSEQDSPCRLMLRSAIAVYVRSLCLGQPCHTGAAPVPALPVRGFRHLFSLCCAFIRLEKSARLSWVHAYPGRNPAQR